MNVQTVDIKTWIDERSVSRYQWLVLLLCFLIVTFDGFDAAIMGFIAPAVIQDWNITRAAFGPILGAAMIGLAVGALVSGPYSDRLGRRRVLLWSVTCFALFSLLSAFASNPTELIILRFLTGIGLGAAMPNSTTLLSEYIPKRLRGRLITLMFMGFGLGSAMGGFVSAWMIPHWGWHSVLLLGGVLPALLVPVLFFLLPESLDFMVNKRYPVSQTCAVLKKMGGTFTDTVQFALAEPSAAPTSGGKIRHLLAGEYRWRTLSLWATYFMGLLVIYLLTGWMPTLIKDSGVTLERAAVVTAMFQLGGLLGILLVGYAMDRFNPKVVIAAAYLGGAACVFTIGLIEISTGLLGVMIFAAGFCINGAQTGLNAFAPAQYPTAFRATGVGWMLGVGRFGGIFGSVIGGTLLSMGLPTNLIFAILGIPAILAAISIISGPRARVEHLTPELNH